MTWRTVIIGAGIVGCAVARELTRYEELEVYLLEKELDVGWGASKANTGIVHAGYDDDPDRFPIRAKLCMIGNKIWHQLSHELQVPVEWCGALVLAFDERDRRVLTELLLRGGKNQVPNLKILGRDMALELEPNISENAVEGLWAPTSGIISPYEAVIALAENAIQNGADLHLDTAVRRIVVRDQRVVGVETDLGFLQADFVINASGIFGDLISRTAGVCDFSIRPRRGEYFILDREATPKIGMTLFPTPQPTTKGVVVTPTTDGNLLVGPNAKDLEEYEREATRTTKEGLDEVWKAASRLVTKLPPSDTVIRTFAGLRPEPDRGDFVVKIYDSPFGLVNCVGMRSPGLTSAPAIAKEVVRLLMVHDLRLTLRRNWKARRKTITKFRELTSEERDRLISNDPSYGNVICTCEMVTEAEIKEAIRRGARTLDSIKFRTRSGMGRCQGSFCLTKMLFLLLRETGMQIEEIALKGRASNVIQSRLRSVSNSTLIGRSSDLRASDCSSSNPPGLERAG